MTQTIGPRVPLARRGRLPGSSAHWVAGWAVLVAACFTVGLLAHPGYPSTNWIPPLHGHPRSMPPTILVPLAVGLAAVMVLPRLARSLSWPALLVTGWAGAAAWAVSLAVVDGIEALSAPMATEHEYLAALDGIGSDPGRWLAGFADLVVDLPTHAAGHPPLATLMFWLLDAVGLSGPGWAAALCIAAGASAVPAVLVTLATTTGQGTARAAAPYLVLAPFALTVATSADAVFLGVSAWGVALLALAGVRRSVPLAVGAGALLGATLYLNYGLIVVGALAVAVLVLRWSPRVLVAAATACLGVVALMTLSGFWWLDGVAATAGRWSDGTGSDRPYLFTIIGNLAVLALLVGPATAAALPRLRRGALAVLVGAGAVAVLALDLAGVTRGEVERIWLPLAPWLVMACAALPARWLRPALLAQLVVALAVQGLVELSW